MTNIKQRLAQLLFMSSFSNGSKTDLSSDHSHDELIRLVKIFEYDFDGSFDTINLEEINHSIDHSMSQIMLISENTLSATMLIESVQTFDFSSSGGK